jgi:hypothetical protein
MQVHTDNLRAGDIQAALRTTGLAARGVSTDDDRPVCEHGSRKRARRIDFYLVATDGHGRRWANSGQRGAGTDKAATWLEWGALIAELYHRDPDALVAYYGSASDFIAQTRRGLGNVKPERIPATVEEWRRLYAPNGVKVIESYERLRRSSNGNPRFRFTFTDGTVLDSMSDAGWAYAVGNPELREGSPVLLDLTPAGRIRIMREA